MLVFGRPFGDVRELLPDDPREAERRERDRAALDRLLLAAGIDPQEFADAALANLGSDDPDVLAEAILRADAADPAALSALAGVAEALRRKRATR